jgi:hypothetical protein
MQIASSANFTCSELRSASLYTATVRMPISLHARDHAQRNLTAICNQYLTKHAYPTFIQ